MSIECSISSHRGGLEVFVNAGMFEKDYFCHLVGLVGWFPFSMSPLSPFSICEHCTEEKLPLMSSEQTYCTNDQVKFYENIEHKIKKDVLNVHVSSKNT